MNTPGDTPAENETLACQVLDPQFLQRLCENPGQTLRGLGIEDPGGEMAREIGNLCDRHALEDVLNAWLENAQNIMGWP